MQAERHRHSFSCSIFLALFLSYTRSLPLHLSLSLFLSISFSFFCVDSPSRTLHSHSHSQTELDEAAEKMFASFTKFCQCTHENGQPVGPECVLFLGKCLFAPQQHMNKTNTRTYNTQHNTAAPSAHTAPVGGVPAPRTQGLRRTPTPATACRAVCEQAESPSYRLQACFRAAPL
jgi:hypothetical protein